MASAKKTDKKASASGSGSLRALLWPVVILVVLGLVGTGGLIGYQKYSAKVAKEREDQAAAAAQAVVANIRRALDDERKSLAALFDPTELTRLLEADSTAIAAKEAQLAASDDRILKARLLKVGTRSPDYDSNPPLGFAAIELLKGSEESGKSPPPEVHLFGKEHQHAVMIWRLVKGEDLVGHLLLAVDVSVLPAAVSKVSIGDGYAELIQAGGGKPLVLAKGGVASARQGAASLRLKVGGTAWRLAFWPGSRLAPSDPLAQIPVWAVGAGAGVLVLGTLLIVMGRQKARARAEVEAEAEEAKLVAQRKAAAAKAKVAAAGRPPAGSEDVEAAYAALDEESGEGGIIVKEEPETVDVPAVIFRAYDVRGVVDETLTPDVVRQLGRSIGSEAYDRGQQTLVVGRDGRNSGPAMQDALVEGLRATGRDVIDVGCVPTPVLYYATEYLNTGSGVMVTGSHNPPQYNGFKVMLGGDTLFGEDIQGLLERIESGEFASGEGNLQRMEVIDEYVRRVCEDIPVALGNSFRIVVDCGNGVAGEVAPKLLRALGHEVVELYCEIDGNFPNHHPDPSDPANLTDLIASVKQEDADLGIAFDGDGDRLGVVDPDGRIVWPDRQMMLFAKDVLSKNAGAEIVFDVKCSNRLAKVIKQLGGKPVMWRTGHSYIKNKLKESGAPLAGEMSGHIFFQDRWYGFDDAIYAAARLLEILMGFKKTPAQVFSKLPAGISTPELRVDMSEGEQSVLIAKLVKSEGFANGKRTTIDGLRVDYSDGWGLARASNTTPSLVLRFEADNEEAMKRIQGEFKKSLVALKPDLQLPF